MADSQGKIYSPLGVSGLPRYAGYVFDEWMTELQGARGRRVLREMVDNSAPIGALKFAMEMLIRQATWTIAPGTDDDEGKADAQLVEEALHDMETSFEDTLADILTMFDYGWSLFETPYKRRDGKNSRYDDGKIGWLGWQMRGQETLLRWEYDSDAAMLPKAFVQLGPPDFKEHVIPMDRCLLFRTTTRRGNPEGRSLWRNAYRSWYMAKHLEAIEAIGAERDMAGLPVGKVPSNILSSDATPDELAVANNWRDLVTNIRRDEQEGVLIPSDRDEMGNPVWELTLLSTGGQRQFNLGDVIARHEQRMLMTCLGDFIMLGNTNAGAQTLGKTKIELFTTAISAFLAQIAAQINDNAIPRLLRVNGRNPQAMPTLRHGDVERMDLDTLGNFLYQLGQAGFTLDTDPQGALMTHLMGQAHLPSPPEDLQAEATYPFDFPDEWEDYSGPKVVPSSRKRPSIKVPNQPIPPRAEPPHVARGPLQKNGTLARADRKRRGAAERFFDLASRQFNEGAELTAVAFDLDDTALAHPDQLVPLAHYLKKKGVQVGVLTGDKGDQARKLWDNLGYPNPDFYYAKKKPATPEKVAEWKAKKCAKLGVGIMVDDFSQGRGAEAFQSEVRKLGSNTLALEVSVGPDTAH
ncbi:MAG: HAD family hydrolase [Acidobacteria bacterium]|nr:HAD family hydrolase [Acidobacteriota bacterium]